MHRYLAISCAAFLLALAAALLLGSFWLLLLLPLSLLSLLLPKGGRTLLRCLLCGILAAVAAFSLYQLRLEKLSAQTGEVTAFEGYVLESGSSSPYATLYAKIGDRWVVLSLANYLPEEESALPGEHIAGTVLLTGARPESDTLLLSGGVMLCGRLLTFAEPSCDAVPLLCRAIRWRQEAIRAFAGAGAGGDAALAMGMLTADLSEVPMRVRSDFSAAGIAHVLAVSGLHLSILVAVVARLCDLMRCSRRVRTALSLLACFVMMVLAGFSVSVLRAALMTGFLLLGDALGRQGDSLTSLATAAALLALCNPAVLQSLSFWLTCTATLGILLFTGPLSRLLPRPRGRLTAIVQQCLTVSLAAQIGALPVTALLFGYLPTYSLLINVLILPLVYLVLCCDLLFLLLTALSLPGGFFFSAACGIASLLRWLARFFAGLPGATLSVQLWWQVLPVVLGLLLLIFLCRVQKGRTRLLLAAAGCLLLCSVLLLTEPLSQRVVLTIDESSGAVLVTKDGEALLLEASDSHWEATALSRLLLRCGSPRLRGILHPDSFHSLTQELRLSRLLEPDYLLCAEETALLGEDLLPPGTTVLPIYDTYSNILPNITISYPNKWCTLLECGTQKVLKCWAGYDIITADNIPPDVTLVIDRAGNCWQREPLGTISRLNGVTAVILP